MDEMLFLKFIAWFGVPTLFSFVGGIWYETRRSAERVNAISMQCDANSIAIDSLKTRIGTLDTTLAVIATRLEHIESLLNEIKKYKNL